MFLGSTGQARAACVTAYRFPQVVLGMQLNSCLLLLAFLCIAAALCILDKYCTSATTTTIKIQAHQPVELLSVCLVR